MRKSFHQKDCLVKNYGLAKLNMKKKWVTYKFYWTFTFKTTNLLGILTPQTYKMIYILFLFLT